MYPAIRRFLRQREGGAYRPVPGAFDPNPTMWGVTQHTYDAWRRGRRLPLRPVYDLTEPEWDDIFHELYLVPSGADRWPWPLSLVMADSAFIAGPAQAVRWLQRALKVSADGQVGPVTEGAVAQRDPKELAISVLGQRIRFHKAQYQRLYDAGKRGEQLPPLNGWLQRCRLLERAAGL